MSEKHVDKNKNNYLKNVKSKFILKRIFDNLKKTKFLNTIRYNKTIQNKLNKDIKDYMKLYSKIKIEIIPAKNMYGKFINFPDKTPYYQIYFNDNKNEIKRTYITKDDKVTKIKIIFYNESKSFCKLFGDCICIQKLNFVKIRSERISDMSFMFSGCASLEEINFSNFNTNNAIDISYMFNACFKLKNINVSNFNTSNVNNMRYMFSMCYQLKELNLSNFNTNKVNNMSYMFSHCFSLQNLNISNFSTNEDTNKDKMFLECKELEKINCSDEFIISQFQSIMK